LYTLTLVYSYIPAEFPAPVLIDLFAEGEWDAAEHDWSLRYNFRPETWHTNIFLFNSLDVPASALLRVIGHGYKSFRFREFTFTPYDGIHGPDTTAHFKGRQDWDLVYYSRVTPEYIRLNATNNTVYLSCNYLTIDPSNSYRLSITARSAGTPHQRDSVFVDLYQAAVYDSPEAELHFDCSALSTGWRKYSKTFSASNIPRNVSLRVFGTLFTSLDVKDVHLEPVPPGTPYTTTVSRVFEPVLYHTNAVLWISQQAEVVSNTLILQADTSNNIIAYARAPDMPSNTLYSLSLIHSWSPIGTPDTVLVDLFEPEAWDNPEHDWVLRPGGTHSNVFIFNTLTIPTSTLLRVIAPGYSSIRFHAFTFAPYEGGFAPATAQYFNAEATWDFMQNCRFTPEYIALMPTNAGMFLIRDHLRIDPSNNYVLSVSARTTGRPTERESLYFDLFQGNLYDSPDSEVQIIGSELSSKWQTFSKMFCASNIPRSVSLRLFGEARSEIQFKDISLVPVSDTSHLPTIPRPDFFGRFSFSKAFAVGMPALIITLVLFLVSAGPSRFRTSFLYGILIIIIIAAVIAGSGAWNRLLSFEILFQLGTILSLLLLCGWWLARLVLPDQYKHVTCLCALPLGFAFLTAGITFACNVLATPYPYAIGLVMGISLCADIIVFTTVAKRRFGWSAESILPMSAAALSFLCLLGPMKSRPPEGLYSDCIDGLINCTGAEYVKQITDRYRFDTGTHWSERENCTLNTDRISLYPGSNTVYLTRHCITLLPWTRYRLSLTVRSDVAYPGNELTADIYHEKHTYQPDSKLVITNTPLKLSWQTYHHDFKTGHDPPLVSLRLLGNLFTTVDVQRVTLEALDRPEYHTRQPVHSYHDPHHAHDSEWFSGSLNYGAHHLKILKRPGTACSLAMVSSLLHIEAHAVYRVWQTVLFMCIPLLVYCIVRMLFNGSCAAGWAAAAITAASPLLAYAVQNNSLAQVQGMLLLLALCMTGVWFIAALRRPRLYTFIAAATCLLLVYAMYLTYMRMLLYVAALLSAGCLFTGLQALYTRFKRLTIIFIGAGSILSIIAVIVFSSHPALRAIMIDLRYPGDLHIMLSPWLLGTSFDYLFAAIPGRDPVVPTVAAAVLASGLFLIALTGLVHTTRRNGWYLLGWVISLVVLYFIAWHYIHNPYLVKKHLSICIPFLGILAGLGFAVIARLRKHGLKLLAIILLALSLATGFYSIWVTGTYWAYKNWYFDDTRAIMNFLGPRLQQHDTIFVDTTRPDEQYLYMMRKWQCLELNSWKAHNTRFAIVDDFAIRRYHRLWISRPSLYTVIYEHNDVKILERKKNSPKPE
jgi:hypothetical protein